MLLALFAFGTSISQIVLAKEVVSSTMRFKIGIGTACLSGIPLLLQLVILLRELCSAGSCNIAFRLLGQKLFFSILGDHGAGACLRMRYYLERVEEKAVDFGYCYPVILPWDEDDDSFGYMLNVNLNLKGLIGGMGRMNRMERIRQYATCSRLWANEQNDRDTTLLGDIWDIAQDDGRDTTVIIHISPIPPTRAPVLVVAMEQDDRDLGGGYRLGKYSIAWCIFGDPFTGQYQRKYISTALWFIPLSRPLFSFNSPAVIPVSSNSPDSPDSLDSPKEEKLPRGSFQRSKIIRGMKLNMFFFVDLGTYAHQTGRNDTLSDFPSECVKYGYIISATGSDSTLSNFSLEWVSSFDSGVGGSCGEANVMEFCRVMKEFDDDTFFVKDPKISVEYPILGKTLHCLTFRYIVETILNSGMKVHARKVTNCCYI